MYAEYDALMESMERSLTTMHDMVNNLHDVRKQIREVIKVLDDDHGALRDAATQLVQRIQDWDSDMVQRKAKAYDDVENFENKFTANYLFLINQTESVIPRVTRASRARHQELMEQWAVLRAEAESISTQVNSLNQQLWDAGIGAIRSGKQRRS